MNEYAVKRIIPLSELDDTPRGGRCAYSPCPNQIDFIVRHEMDGDVDSFYFVCRSHKVYEDGTKLLGS